MKNNLFKKTFVVLVIILLTNSVYSQNVYFRLNGGYAFSSSTQNLEDFNNTSVTDNAYTFEQIGVSLGKGLNFGGVVGYKFNDNLGAELNFSMLKSDKFVSSQINYDDLEETVLNANMFQIKPTFVVYSGMEGFNPYAKLGLIVGLGSIDSEYTYLSSGDKTYMKAKLDGGTAFGFTGGLGALYEINDNMSFFAEININSLSYSPDKGVITVATYNGENLLDDMTTKQKEVEYVDEIIYNFDDDPSPDSEPSQSLRIYFPFSNVGINVGIQYNL